MVIVDLNLLVHTVNEDFPDRDRAIAWLEGYFRRQAPVGLPWVALTGFVRITTNRRAMAHPLSLETALQQVKTWLSLPGVTTPSPGRDHAHHFAELCRASNTVGNLVSDAHLAAMAVERDCELASNDTDFARFPGLRWVNPLAA